MSNLDLIATVDIQIEKPVMDESSFNSILVVGPLPAVAPAAAPDQVARYASLDEVEEAGWVTSGDGADPVGIAALVAFSQPNRPSSIMIAPLQTKTVSGATVKEPAVEAVKRAMSYAGWYVVCPVGIENTVDGSGNSLTVADQYNELAAYIELQEKMFCYTELDALATGASLPTVTGEYYRTIGVYGKVHSTDADVPEYNKCMNVASALAWLYHKPGSETFAFKAVSLIAPSELDMDHGEVEHLEEINLCYVVQIGDTAITMHGKTLAGEWADIVRFRDWLKTDVQRRVCSVFLANPKVPYTDAGIALVHNQILAALEAGVKAGGIADEEFDSSGNSIPSYTTHVPTAAEIPTAQKTTRKLIGCSFRARIAGAIHFAEVRGTLTYKL